MRLLPWCVACWALVACTTEEKPAKPAGAASRPSVAPIPEIPADPMSEPATAFAFMLEKLRAHDVDALKACMVESARDQVVKADLEFSDQRMGSVPASDLAATIEVDGDRATLKQKSKAVLCTLVRIDGKWFAEARWWLTKPE